VARVELAGLLDGPGRLLGGEDHNERELAVAKGGVAEMGGGIDDRALADHHEVADGAGHLGHVAVLMQIDGSRPLDFAIHEGLPLVHHCVFGVKIRDLDPLALEMALVVEMLVRLESENEILGLFHRRHGQGHHQGHPGNEQGGQNAHDDPDAHHCGIQGVGQIGDEREADPGGDDENDHGVPYNKVRKPVPRSRFPVHAGASGFLYAIAFHFARTKSNMR